MSLNLPSLEYRRRVADMIQVYKFLKSIERIDSERFFKLSQTKTRGHSLKLYKPRTRLNIRKNTFSSRVIDDWNSLPEQLVSQKNAKQFRAGLQDHWQARRFSNPFDS